MDTKVLAFRVKVGAAILAGRLFSQGSAIVKQEPRQISLQPRFQRAIFNPASVACVAAMAIKDFD
jgi:hypothetical protein